MAQSFLELKTGCLTEAFVGVLLQIRASFSAVGHWLHRSYSESSGPTTW